MQPPQGNSALCPASPLHAAAANTKHRIDCTPCPCLPPQGLLLAFDYNREESQGAFSACLALDPAAAMCHWGLAYALGPYLNVVAGTEAEAATFPVFGPAEFEQAQASAQQALALAEQVREL